MDTKDDHSCLLALVVPVFGSSKSSKLLTKNNIRLKKSTIEMFIASHYTTHYMLAGFLSGFSARGRTNQHS